MQTEKISITLCELNPSRVLELAGKKQLLCYDAKSCVYTIVNSKEDIAFAPGILYFSFNEI